MNRIVLLILLCVQGVLCQSQSIIVVDSLDKTPLSFVALKYPGGGLYTNEIGKFNLEDIKGNRLQLSLLGFKAKDIAKTEVRDTIFLSPTPTALDEITIVNRLEKETIYKKPKKTNFYGSTTQVPKTQVLLILIPDADVADSKFKDLTLYFKRKRGLQNDKNNSLENIDAFVRINLFEVENDKPTVQIYASEPIKISSLKNDEIILNLQDRMISIPNKGIAIGVEMIGYYDKEYNEMSAQGNVRPMLTPEKYEHFKAITYKYFPFRTNGGEMMLMSDFLKSMGVEPKHQQRNLAIGMTLSH